jgi:hypothetical protein
VLAIAITTAPRPVATFAPSYASFRKAGFDEAVHVLADGTNPDVYASSGRGTVHIHNPPLGGLKNWAHALETLVNNSAAPWLMVLEDDIRWAHGAAAALEKDLRDLDRELREKVGYLSLYLSRKVSREIESRKGRRLKPGIYSTALAGGCWGSQAYVFTREGAVALLTDPTFDDHRRNYVKNRNRDGIVSGCLAAMGRRLYYRVPCLVDHAYGNANSSLGPKPVQRNLLTDYWTGRP